MRRTRAWWASLNRRERVELVALERDDKRSGRSPYLPYDCSECWHCGTPHLGSGLCPLCSDRLDSLIAKANQAMEVAA